VLAMMRAINAAYWRPEMAIWCDCYRGFMFSCSSFLWMGL